MSGRPEVHRPAQGRDPSVDPAAGAEAGSDPLRPRRRVTLSGGHAVAWACAPRAVTVWRLA